jgi:hypothetical protein
MDAAKKIGLHFPRTIVEWNATFDRFWLSATPKLFEWLRWVIVLAAITYAKQQSNSLLLKGLLALCYIAMIWYFQAFFAQYELESLPLVKSKRVKIYLSIALALFMSVGVNWLIRASIDSLVAVRP